MRLTLNYRLVLISASARTQYFAAVAVLNMYAVHDLNDMGAYTLCTVHEQDLVVARDERKNYTHVVAYVLYST